jgi:hypothetical protein
MRGKNMFKKTDLTRAIVTAQKAGLKINGFEIGPDGRIVVMTAKPGEPPAAAGNEWDTATDAA